MTTKESIFITSVSSCDSYDNLNLNQNVQKPKFKLASFESYKPCNKMSAAASIMKSKNMCTSNTFTEDATNDFTRNNEQTKERKLLSTGKATNSKSSLSLHIAVHENSDEIRNFDAGENVKTIIKAKNNFFNSGCFGVIQNPFEFPRQQENNDSNIPEVVEFRASQRLLNPNSNLNATASTASVIVPSHNVPEIVQELNVINPPPSVQNGNELQIIQLPVNSLSFV
uniref:Uncharacterized protein n=1 Tax=Panagrolaimus davidi TaxID=227884 RepID=A0A914QZX9_9BILA